MPIRPKGFIGKQGDLCSDTITRRRENHTVKFSEERPRIISPNMIRRHNIHDYGVKNKNKLVIGDFHVTQVIESRNWNIGEEQYTNNVPKFRGCTIFRTQVIRQRVSLKIIVFRMETPFWSPSEDLQHGGRKPVKTSGVYFGSFTTFIVSVKLENIRIVASLKILVTWNSWT